MCSLLAFRLSPEAPSDSVPSVEGLPGLTTADAEDEFPAIGGDAAGQVWVAWVSYGGTADAVLVSRLDRQAWSPPKRLSAPDGDYWRPAMATDGQGRLWVTWSQNQEGNWDLWGRFLAEGRWSEALQLTRHPGNDFAQKLAVDRGGQVWMAWQAVRDRNYEVLLARVTPEGLCDTQNVSNHPANDWEPAVAATTDGRVFVAWDSYRTGSYDVLVSECHKGQVGEPLFVAASPDYEAHAALAVDPQNRLWIAWDNGGPKWGQHGDARQRLHSRRSVDVRCLDKGRLFAPQQDLTAALTGELANFCELPELQVDGAGRLWLVVRHLTDVTNHRDRQGNGLQQVRGVWNPWALYYADGRWSAPTRLPESNGRNDMRTALWRDPQGRVWAAWAEDGRKETLAEEPVNHEVRAAMLRAPRAAAVALPVKPAPLPARPAVPLPPSEERHRLTVNGKSYRLLFGDTHRHTDISRCAMNYDGSLMDTYRYAIDAAGLDFLAISDHDQDLLKHRYHRKQGPLQGYAWWRSQKYCDLFFMADKFLPIYGYEHGGSFAARGGHKNVLYPERGLPCLEQDAPKELFAALKGSGAVVIPHQLADGNSATDWAKWDADFERVAEIFQTRGSYEHFGALPGVRLGREGHFLQDALAKDVRIGVIASSDHGLVHRAYAGVYAAAVSRRGVLEALRSRRSFGATDQITIEFRHGDHVLGDVVTARTPPSFRVLVRGTAALKAVQVVKDGKTVYSTKPKQTTCWFDYQDQERARDAGSHYYVRCEQQDGEYAWSSPIWVE
jgi:hypothetical protein